jgi:hypothetical protein
VPERYPFPYLCTLFARVRALIYLGRAGDAVATIEAARAGIRRAGLLHVQFFRVDVTSLHAFAALAALAERRAEPQQLTALVTRAVRRLRRERVAWATALAAAIEASLATLTLLPGQAAQSLVAAADQLAECGLGLHASAMRHQAARWCRSTGRAVSGADHWADHPLIANPDALAQSITPLPICG